MSSFFNPDSALMRGLGQVADLLFLNIITVVFCIPVVTAGASMTAMHYYIIRMQEKTDGHMFRIFWKQFRLNFRKSTALWLVIAAIAAFLYADYRILSPISGYFVIPIYAAAIVLAAVFLYVFPLTAKFENTIGATLKNALIMAIGYLPQTVAMLIIDFVILFVCTQVTRLYPLAFFFGLSLPAFLRSYLYWPAMKKVIDKAESEKQGEQESAESGAQRNKPDPLQPDSIFPPPPEMDIRYFDNNNADRDA